MLLCGMVRLAGRECGVKELVRVSSRPCQAYRGRDYESEMAKCCRQCTAEGMNGAGGFPRPLFILTAA